LFDIFGDRGTSEAVCGIKHATGLFVLRAELAALIKSNCCSTSEWEASSDMTCEPLENPDMQGSTQLKSLDNSLNSTASGSPEPWSAEPGTAARDNALPWWKRFLDLTCVVVSLPFWLTVFAGIALWIKLTSPGPLLFRQQRLGYRGTPFTILKFRTMEVNVETQSHEQYLRHLISAGCPMTKLDVSQDPRIIRGGRLLRALGLDELPQLINVLRREMSLVGPRPGTPQEFQWYETWQYERLNAVPGLTGYWQVNGKNKTTFREMIEMDIYYSKNASFFLDLLILIKTPMAIIGQVLEPRIYSGRRKVRRSRVSRGGIKIAE
jgi:exopolysaccharide production protein ExoY